MKQIITVDSRIDKIEVDFFKPDNWDEEKLVILCHGFNSGKESASYKQIGKCLLENGIAYAIFSLPYHAERRGDYNDFTLANCIEDSELVEKTIREKYPNTKIGILGTSFGGYLTLLRLQKYKHDYFAIILKSPAIKMDTILKSIMGEDGFKLFNYQGYVEDNSKDTPMRINLSFYEELTNNRIMDNPNYDENILIYHGTIDDTAPYEDSLKFASQNANTTLVTLENENHRLSEGALHKLSAEVADYCKNR